MKLLFVENRYATVIWSEVAQHLSTAGHEIHWIVQNPVFRPQFGVVHQLPFPHRIRASHVPVETDLNAVKYPDRSVTYYGRTRAHHGPYRRAINRLIGELLPDVVFGEQTQIHELLAIEAAKALQIPYLCPTATRYPVDRMTFCVNDTMQTIGGSGDRLADSEAREMLGAIRERRVVPSYMRAPQMRRWRRALHRAQDKARITWGWLRGERYLTPSPWRKFRLDRRHAENRRAWESFAREGSDDVRGGKWVLYPLQMQPEANIEVWGYPWHDQVEILRRVADTLAESGTTLIVKPNPKSKYEMSRALCELCASHPAIVPMSHRVKMHELLPRATAVLSVTGTVILEAAFARKPVAVLGDHDLARIPGVRSIAAPEEIHGVLLEVTEDRYPYADEQELIAYLRRLYAESYPGTPFDPVNQPELATESNLRALCESFTALLQDLPRLWSRRGLRARELQQ